MRLWGLATLALQVFPDLKRSYWEIWYDYCARTVPDPTGWRFMNFGYAPVSGSPDELHPADSSERYGAQMYQHVTATVDLTGCDVLEVGSGRGGGCSFISRYRRPGTMVGVDLSSAAIALCNTYHRLPGLRFVPGNALALPFQSDSFDAVINIESSHCYPSMPRFLAEVRRVLKWGGHFLFADLRRRELLPLLGKEVAGSELRLIHFEDISAAVVRAIELDSARREDLIRRLAPLLLRWPVRHFAGVRGSIVHRALVSGRSAYVHYVLRK